MQLKLIEAIALIPGDFYLVLCTLAPTKNLTAALYQRGVERPVAGAEAPFGYVETFEARVISMIEQRFVGVDECEIQIGPKS